MNYYELFHLTKEPFANSPDPDLFYYSVQHHDCLQKLELALRLRRGLSVVIGAIGTGKSTMCRTLLRLIDDESGAISAHLILDPAFTSPLEFLATIVTTFGIENDCKSEWRMKESIKNYLLYQSVDRNTIPVLLIDEGQKLPDFCIEILREFLNFETNQNKLLEIVIFAQQEFEEMLKNKPNFSDRITTLHKLGPLCFKETRAMIRYRIQQCRKDGETDHDLFPSLSLFLIFLLSKGYPRKIVMLCSKILLAMLVKEKKRATLSVVWNSATETSFSLLNGMRKGVYTAAALFLLVAGVLLWNDEWKLLKNIKNRFLPSNVSLQQTQNIQPATVVSSPPSVIEVIKGKEAAPPELKNQEKSHSVGHPPPAELGYLTVQSGMSLSRMITRVYGRDTPDNIRLVLKANPYISDPAKLKLETKIFFPHLPDSPTSRLTPFIVRLGEFSSLQSAHDFLITCLKTEKKVRIVPIWDEVSKLTFLVVLGEIFQKEEQALEALSRLDSRFRSTATVLRELGGIPL